MRKMAAVLVCSALLSCVASRLHAADKPGSRINGYPWVLPVDIKDWVADSDLVAAGTIVSTERKGNAVVDRTKVSRYIATIKFDRVFKGPPVQSLTFDWYGLTTPKGQTGILYSGPPLAEFLEHKRYMVFLKRFHGEWRTTVPLFAMQQLLQKPRSANVRLIAEPRPRLNGAIAEELVAAAYDCPAAQEHVTCSPYMYFNHLYQLIGACAEPFFKDMRRSPDYSTKRSAENWLAIIMNNHERCAN